MTLTQAKQCLKNTDKDTLKDLIEQFGEELVWKYLDESGYNLDSMEEAYNGEWASNEEFVRILNFEIQLFHQRTTPTNKI